MKNEVVWLRWAHHEQITNATKVRGPSSALVFSHLAWVPHLPGPPHQAPRAAAFHPCRAGGRTHAQTVQTVTSPPSRRPAFLHQGACAPPLKRRLSEAGAWRPPALRSRHPPGGGVRRKGGVPDRDPYLPTEPRVEQARRVGNCDGGSKRAVPRMLFRVCR